MWEELWEAGLHQGGANNSVQDCLQSWATVDTTSSSKAAFAHHGTPLVKAVILVALLVLNFLALNAVD